MNKRASELAHNLFKNDFANLDQNPLGIPLQLLNPRKDSIMSDFITELRRDKRIPSLNNKVKDITAKMNERALEMASQALYGHRDSYLHNEYDGVPHSVLPLNTDNTFRSIEV